MRTRRNTEQFKRLYRGGTGDPASEATCVRRGKDVADEEIEARPARYEHRAV